MTSETIELPPGGPHHDSPRHDPPSSSGASGEPRPPGEPTSNNDELSRLLSELATKPDRLLGSYSTEEPFSAQPPPPAPEAPVAKLEPGRAGFVRRGRGPECVPVGDTRSAGDCSTAPPAVAAEPLLVALDSSPEIPSLPMPPLVDVAAAVSSPGSFKAFPALDLGAPISHTARAESPKEAEPEEEDEEYDENESLRGASWPFILLFSYASAVTIGLIWVLWGGLKIRAERGGRLPGGQHRPRPRPPGRPVAKGRLAPVDRLRPSDDPRPTPPDGLAGGHPAGHLLGQCEAPAPFDSVQDRDGGDNALRLKLRLRTSRPTPSSSRSTKPSSAKTSAVNSTAPSRPPTASRSRCSRWPSRASGRSSARSSASSSPASRTRPRSSAPPTPGPRDPRDDLAPPAPDRHQPDRHHGCPVPRGPNPLLSVAYKTKVSKAGRNARPTRNTRVFPWSGPPSAPFLSRGLEFLAHVGKVVEPALRVPLTGGRRRSTAGPRLPPNSPHESSCHCATQNP